MTQQFSLFLSNSAGNRDIPQVIASSRKREDVCSLVFTAVFAIERFDPGVGKDGNGNRATSRAGGYAGEPRPESFRASMRSALFDHAHLKAQTCPPFPVNDS